MLTVFEITSALGGRHDFGVVMHSSPEQALGWKNSVELFSSYHADSTTSCPPPMFSPSLQHLEQSLLLDSALYLPRAGGKFDHSCQPASHVLAVDQGGEAAVRVG